MPFPTQEDVILETEKELGCRFPTSFRNKMMKENGGEVDIFDDNWQLFPFYDKTNRKTISRTCNSISKETERARTYRDFPQNAIVIGKNAMGDFLVFLKENDTIKNEVYAWLGDEDIPLTKIAEDFSELYK